MQIEVVLPSGMRGLMRGLKVKDEKLLTDRKLAQTGRLFPSLLAACWEQTIDAGPYDFGSSEVPNWDKVISADRGAAILQLRVASYGKDYDFTLNCESEACRRRYGWSIDLTELNVTNVPEVSLQHIRTSEAISIDVNGQMFKCRLLTGADDKYFAKLSGKDASNMMTHHLARQIVEIPGVEAHMRAIVAAIEDMPSADADDLRDRLDDLNGGVETTFMTQCPHCWTEQRVDLPFEASFFSKRKRFSSGQ